MELHCCNIMAAREGHVSAIWLASDAAADHRGTQHTSETETGFDAGGWNQSRITWDELNDARSDTSADKNMAVVLQLAHECSIFLLGMHSLQECVAPMGVASGTCSGMCARSVP